MIGLRLKLDWPMLIAIAACLLVGFALGLQVGQLAPARPPAPIPEASPCNITLLEMKRGWYAPYDCIVGSITNEGPGDADLVRLDFNLVSRTGAIIGNESLSVRDLVAHSTWSFRLLLSEPGAHNASLVRIHATP